MRTNHKAGRGLRIGQGLMRNASFSVRT
uniref:Uncharacterized protein n=1 Tax=Latilactobacillus sakei TaxID=1599 RepID=A0A2H1MYF7_LATSK|nr:Protein of unknown function [Latilactobacillus sakei]